MSLVTATIPEDPAQLAGWLERQLAGLHLGALVAELAAVHPDIAGPPLEEVLGEHREAILAGGLSALQPAALHQLLRHPRLLLQLQELVLLEGGAYWQRLLSKDADVTAMARRGEQRLAALLGEPATLPLNHRSRQRRVLSFVRPLATALVGAAAAVAVVWTWREPLAQRFLPGSAAPVAWGWNKLGEPAPAMSPSDYLRQLADAASEWKQQQPQDAAALARRIEQMREGCSQLIFAAHPPLSPEDRRWLREKCRAWGTKFDRSLEALEAGQSVPEVLAEMNATVDQLAATLRQRADEHTAS